MTKAEWDAMDSGEKDALVWVHVMPQLVCDTYFTTDRNACALVLDEIARRGLVDRFLDAIRGALDELFVSQWNAIRIDPDTICYAALKAVEDE